MWLLVVVVAVCCKKNKKRFASYKNSLEFRESGKNLLRKFNVTSWIFSMSVRREYSLLVASVLKIFVFVSFIIIYMISCVIYLSNNIYLTIYLLGVSSLVCNVPL